ncbi:ABC transporter substrate-binding protein [Pseudaeromonas paramecii]|uniref:Probable sugar-binding periplasmic protein n=2 Tax=Pseudaeromonas paramecii TaxID=2138166 RepID=A0ABP8Q9L1_9GAMM
MFRYLLWVVVLCLPLDVLSVTLTMETWRVDDQDLWQKTLSPILHQTLPEVDIQLNPVKTSDYDATLRQRLDNNAAGDLIICRPYDQSLALFQAGHLVDLTEFPGMENFPRFAKSAWQTDTGAATFCLPIASVIQGFFYNVDIFKQLQLQPPTTREEFFAVLERIRQDGRYLPLALAAHDNWVVSELGFLNIGPAYWKGEDGRLALIHGERPFNSAPFVAALDELRQWKPYIGPEPEQRTEAQTVKDFAEGKAAIIVAGSWSIPQFTGKVNFAAFHPPVGKRGDACYFVDHTDMGIGINSASPHKEAAWRLLEWMSSDEFAEAFSNAVPGFFSLSNHFFELQNPVAQQMMSWRDECDSTIRLGAQFLSRGEPAFNAQLNQLSQAVVLGTRTPEEVADQIQQALASWYGPQARAN